MNLFCKFSYKHNDGVLKQHHKNKRRYVGYKIKSYREDGYRVKV